MAKADWNKSYTYRYTFNGYTSKEYLSYSECKKDARAYLASQREAIASHEYAPWEDCEVEKLQRTKGHWRIDYVNEMGSWYFENPENTTTSRLLYKRTYEEAYYG